MPLYPDPRDFTTCPECDADNPYGGDYDHTREDALWWDVLGSIADGREDAAAAAEAARSTSQIHFTRHRA